LYYLRARYHNPDTGRFWSTDNYEGDNSDPASLHKYTYSQNNPVNGCDPSGHDEIGFATTIAANTDFNFWGSINSLSFLYGVDLTPTTCGPDVTEAVMKTMNNVERKFIPQPYATKVDIASYVPWGMGDGWDIGPLKDLGFDAATASQFGSDCHLGSGFGKLTVQFSIGGVPKVYYGGSANYILWGRMFCLLHEFVGRNPLSGAKDPEWSENAAVAEAWLYKSFFWWDWGTTKLEADAFVRFGYSATDPSSTALPIEPNLNNDNVANPNPPNGIFDWKWRGLQGD
jgi:hypothetical protein